MYSYNSNIFTDVNKISQVGDKITYNGILLASKLNQKNGQDYKLLDAIDIDWNGAVLSFMGSPIYTSDDLMYALEILNKNNDLGELNKNVESIIEQLEQIKNSYITYSYLDTFISESLQEKLIPGSYISISDDNVISVYNLPTYEYLSDTYTTQYSFNLLSEYVYDSIYDKDTSDKRAAYFASYYVSLVVAEAPEAFDTLKEIADWILDQNEYIPVDKDDIINNWQDDLYYYLDEESGEYKKVPDVDFVESHPEYKYFKVKNYLTDISDLLDRVDILENKVGDKIWNEDTQTYTTSGIYSDINNLEYYLTLLQEYVDSLSSSVDNAVNTANTAYSEAKSAKEKAEEAISTANTALTETAYAKEISEEAYKVAKKASEDVGLPSIPADYVQIPYEDLESFKEENPDKTILEKTGQNSYVVAKEPFIGGREYYYYREYVEGTGLTGRVEKVESDIDNVYGIALDAKLEAQKSLFNLSTAYTSDYVKAELTPDKFNDSPYRLLTIDTKEGKIDATTGEIYSDGLVSIETCSDIYAYMSSWLILGLDEEDIKSI